MTEQTPIKKNPVTPTPATKYGFSPVVLPQSPGAVSPQKNIVGLPRVAKDIIADVYNNIQKWNDRHIAGAKIIKEIVISRTARNCDLNSPEVETLLDELYDIVQNLHIYSSALEFLSNQMMSLAKLHKDRSPLFISLTVDSIAELLHHISESYKLELKAKQYILENIAYVSDTHEAMFHAACWTHQYNVTDDVNLKLETLLVESGHRKITETKR